VLAAEPAREQRKVVTVLFCDVKGSTALGESLDPEALRVVMGRYFDVARIAIERHGGTLEKFIGDAVMAVFGVPTVREDDAFRAIRAAQELRDAVEIDVRIGVNTGEVVTGSGDSLVTGDAVNVAARLEQAAAPGEVLIGAETYALVRDAVDVELLPPVGAKGKSSPVTAYRLIAVTGDTAFARRADVPLVGRDRERRLLADAWERATSERATALFTILGSAGVGKSRLAAEFVDGLDATVLRGRCLSYGDGITYWAVVEVVKQLLGATPPPDQAIAALLGDGQATKDDIAISVRKLFESHAAERPLVVCFDDLHWAEPTFLDLIEHIADWSRDAPILLLCLARPELLERRSSWGGGKLNATIVLLEPLSAAETDDLIDGLLTGRDLDPSLRARIRAAADGNPLFVEQMLAMVETSPDDVTVPATIQALLSARLDQLPTAERATLERGAVEGQVFHRGAVVALGPDDADVTSHLSGLIRKELVRPSVATLPGDDAFRFRHLLIRDAAYDALPKSARADLHELFAAWIEERTPDLVELDEILGYHLEQAALYRVELGQPAPTLAARAAARLGAAGRRALARVELSAAVNLLDRATGLLPADSVARPRLLVDHGRALYDAGRLEEADVALGEAIERGDRDVAATAFFVRTFMQIHAFGLPIGEGEDNVRRAVAELEQGSPKAATLAQGYRTLASILMWRGKNAEQVEAAERAIVHAQRPATWRSKPRRTAKRERAAFTAPRAGPTSRSTPGRSLRRRSGLDRRCAVLCSALQARPRRRGASRRRGRIQRTFAVISRSAATRLGSSRPAWEQQNASSSPGISTRAEEAARATWEGLGAIGERGFRSTVGGHLAQALVGLGRIEDAVAILDESEALGSEDDWVTVALVRYGRALIASASGEHDSAVALARGAVSVADERETLNFRAQLWLGLGRILLAADRRDEAREAIVEALRLAELKGSTVFVDEARALLAELAPAG
jgi:class 3 adenylate cyclase/tetratricopeptide (TPR) repeat protein